MMYPTLGNIYNVYRVESEQSKDLDFVNFTLHLWVSTLEKRINTLV